MMTAKLIADGGSRADCLPEGYRFEDGADAATPAP